MDEEDQIKKEIDEALQLFRYLPSKDIFEAFFNKRLIKRLMIGQSYSQELEEYVVQKLKEECGESYTKKAVDILQDLKTSTEFKKEFDQYAVGKGHSDLSQKLIVSVFSSAAWPNENIKIPQFYEPFQSLQNIFTEFYKQKNSGASLFWQHQLSTVDLYGHFNQKITFIVSLHQAFVLCLFNEKAQWTYQEIGEKLQIEKEDLKMTLVSLFHLKPSQRLLIKTGEQKQIQENDVFSVNESYSSVKNRVKVNTAQKKESQQQINDVMERVIHDRQYVLDASIVKIMKLKKSLTHQQLNEQVFNDLKLPINKTEIKNRIESLIDRDYLKRDQSNKQLYHYQA